MGLLGRGGICPEDLERERRTVQEQQCHFAQAELVVTKHAARYHTSHLQPQYGKAGLSLGWAFSSNTGLAKDNFDKENAKLKYFTVFQLRHVPGGVIKSSLSPIQCQQEFQSGYSRETLLR